MVLSNRPSRGRARGRARGREGAPATWDGGGRGSVKQAAWRQEFERRRNGPVAEQSRKQNKPVLQLDRVRA